MVYGATVYPDRSRTLAMAAKNKDRERRGPGSQISFLLPLRSCMIKVPPLYNSPKCQGPSLVHTSLWGNIQGLTIAEVGTVSAVAGL